MMLRSLLAAAAAVAGAAGAGAVLACPPLLPEQAAGLALPQALARVADCHPDVRAARAALAGAAADVQLAGQRPNPQLTLGAGSIGSSLGSGSPWNKTFDHSVRVDQLVERGNKPGLRRAAAQAAREAAAADVADAQRRGEQAVAHVHQDLWAAQARLAQLTESARLGAESLRLLERRVQAGDAPALDATRLRLDDARVQADLRQARADVADLQRQLALLIGATELASRLTPLPAPLPALPGQEVLGVDQRADVQAAAARVAAAEQARDLAAAQRSRDVSVGVQLDRYPTSPSNGSGSGNTVSFSVSVPLFVHHGLEGELARAEADLAAAREALVRVQAQAASELARADDQARAAQDRRRLVAEQLEPAAEKVAAGAELAYSKGASSALELLDARRSLRAVRIERITADADLAKALADRLFAQGRPAAAPLTP